MLLQMLFKNLISCLLLIEIELLLLYIDVISCAFLLNLFSRSQDFSVYSLGFFVLAAMSFVNNDSLVFSSF